MNSLIANAPANEASYQCIRYRGNCPKAYPACCRNTNCPNSGNEITNFQRKSHPGIRYCGVPEGFTVRCSIYQINSPHLPPAGVSLPGSDRVPWVEGHRGLPHPRHRGLRHPRQHRPPPLIVDVSKGNESTTLYHRYGSKAFHFHLRVITRTSRSIVALPFMASPGHSGIRSLHTWATKTCFSFAVLGFDRPGPFHPWDHRRV